MTTKVSEKEATIVELLRQGLKPSEINNRLNGNLGTLYADLNRLSSLKIIKRTGMAQFIPLADSLEITDSAALYKLRYGRPVELETNIHPYFKVEITPSIRNEIEKYYIRHKGGRIDRSVLVKALGIPRYLLNVEVMSMGLETRGMDVDELSSVQSSSS